MPNQSEMIKKNEFDRVLLVEASAEQIKNELAEKPELKAFVRLPNNVQQMTEIVFRNIRTSEIQSLQEQKKEQIEQLSNSNLDPNFRSYYEASLQSINTQLEELHKPQEGILSVVEVRSITPGDFISGVGVAGKSFNGEISPHQILIEELYDQIFHIECGGLYNFGQREVIDDEANFEVASDLSDREFGLQAVDPLVIEAETYFERVHPPLPSVGDVRLVVGENHGMCFETEATDYIYNLLPELAKTNTPLFLEFLPWEIWEPVLTHYHKASAHDEISALEDCIQGMLANIRRAMDSPGNEDLFRLIKEAKQQGVQVHGCETVASFNASNSQSHGATRNRCVVAEYATRKILEEIGAENFCVLFGNAHLCYEIGQEGENYVKPGLGELLGANQTIGFCVKEDAFKMMESNVLPGRVLVVHNQEEINNAQLQKEWQETEAFNAAAAKAASENLAVAGDVSQSVFSDLSKSLLGVDLSQKRDGLIR